MRWVEHRRHSHRDRPEPHLSQRGVELARSVGAGLGPFQRVVTSPAPRAIETAVAMGFAVTECREELATLGPAVEAAVPSPVTWVDYAFGIRRSPVVARLASAQADLLRSVAESLPDGRRALLVSHGGIVELGAAAARPADDPTAWGPVAGYCEGVRLAFDGREFVGAEILRVGGP